VSGPRATGPGASLARRAHRAWSRTVHHLLPPTLYFLVAFNAISLTTRLLMFEDRWFDPTSIVLASTTALVVAKVVLVVDRVRLIDRFRGAPLIQPILYKSLFYSLVVLAVRLLERWIDFALDAGDMAAGLQRLMAHLAWHRFVAVHLWIFFCFLVYVAASELNALTGEGQLWRLLFRHRSRAHRLSRRQHVRALMELSRLAEHTPRERLLDPASREGGRLLAIMDALRQQPATSA
jgi:hypothetical protein